jgi:hypothetical protein
MRAARGWLERRGGEAFGGLGLAALLAALLSTSVCRGQAAPEPEARAPIAYVPNDGKDPNAAAEVTGAMEVDTGRAVIRSSGIVSAGEHTVPITLPQRGQVRLCPASKVGLTTDSSVRGGDRPGLMMTLDHGAMEANFATGVNSDVILTPDFRILISGPGIAAVRVRLGAKGDTCVDNSLGDRGTSGNDAGGVGQGAEAPYVSVSSVFDGGLYRVQPGQRVMFQHGSLHEVVDDEKEPCGCTAEKTKADADNAFPAPQSTGLSLHPAPAIEPGPKSAKRPEAVAELSHNGAPQETGETEGQSQNQVQGQNQVQSPTRSEATGAASPAGMPAAAPAATGKDAGNASGQPAPKARFLTRVGRFFRRLFGG